jgi:hypothetical protein
MSCCCPKFTNNNKNSLQQRRRRKKKEHRFSQSVSNLRPGMVQGTTFDNKGELLLSQIQQEQQSPTKKKAVVKTCNYHHSETKNDEWYIEEEKNGMIRNNNVVEEELAGQFAADLDNMLPGFSDVDHDKMDKSKRKSRRFGRSHKSCQ